VLAEDALVKPTEDIIKKYEKKCPKCGKELEKDASKIVIIPYGKEVGPSEKNQPGQKNPAEHYKEDELGI